MLLQLQVIFQIPCSLIIIVLLSYYYRIKLKNGD